MQTQQILHNLQKLKDIHEQKPQKISFKASRFLQKSTENPQKYSQLHKQITQQIQDHESHLQQQIQSLQDIIFKLTIIIEKNQQKSSQSQQIYEQTFQSPQKPYDFDYKLKQNEEYQLYKTNFEIMNQQEQLLLSNILQSYSQKKPAHNNLYDSIQQFCFTTEKKHILDSSVKINPIRQNPAPKTCILQQRNTSTNSKVPKQQKNIQNIICNNIQENYLKTDPDHYYYQNEGNLQQQFPFLDDTKLWNFEEENDKENIANIDNINRNNHHNNNQHNFLNIPQQQQMQQQQSNMLSPSLNLSSKNYSNFETFQKKHPNNTDFVIESSIQQQQNNKIYENFQKTSDFQIFEKKEEIKTFIVQNDIEHPNDTLACFQNLQIENNNNNKNTNINFISEQQEEKEENQSDLTEIEVYSDHEDEQIPPTKQNNNSNENQYHHTSHHLSSQHHQEQQEQQLQQIKTTQQSIENNIQSYRKLNSRFFQNNNNNDTSFLSKKGKSVDNQSASTKGKSNRKKLDFQSQLFPSRFVYDHQKINSNQNKIQNSSGHQNQKTAREQKQSRVSEIFSQYLDLYEQ